MSVSRAVSQPPLGAEAQQPQHAQAQPQAHSQHRAPLTSRQRLLLIADSALSPEDALSMTDEAFDFSFFQTHGIESTHIRAARLNPAQLKSRGVRSASDLRALAFNALDLVDASWCASAIAAFGSDEVVSAFVLSANDAVAISGTGAMHQLGLDVPTLLLLCTGHPTEALGVLKLAQPRSHAIRNVPPATLLDCQIGAKALRELGFQAEDVAMHTRATAQQLEQLGF